MCSVDDVLTIWFSSDLEHIECHFSLTFTLFGTLTFFLSNFLIKLHWHTLFLFRLVPWSFLSVQAVSTDNTSRRRPVSLVSSYKIDCQKVCFDTMISYTVQQKYVRTFKCCFVIVSTYSDLTWFSLNQSRADQLKFPLLSVAEAW